MAQSILPSLSRFQVYVLALELAELVYAIPVRGTDRTQLHDAMGSVVRNIAEGAGQNSVAGQGRFYSYSHGSLKEVASSIDLLVCRRRTVPRLAEIIVLIRRVDGALRSLLRRR